MKVFTLGCLLFFLQAFVSCNRNDHADPAPATLSYGDSIFYLKSGSSDYIVQPTSQAQGSYTSFPQGLELNPSTGAINVSQSESGLRYKVTFTPVNGAPLSTYVVISGINFPDKFYYLKSNDSIAFPVYNADPSRSLPAGNFDEDKVANNSGCAMKTTDGQINLNESIRRGLFGNIPKSDDRKGFDIKFRLNDASGSSLNKIKVLLYYYDKWSDVPEDLKQTMSDHLGMTLQPNNTPVSSAPISLAAPKPRPPCIVIIAN